MSTTTMTVDERLQWMREYDERVEANYPAVPACPDWCRDIAGHESDADLSRAVSAI